MDNYNTKQCYMCERDLVLNKNNFYKDSKSKDGFRKICKDCHKKRRKITEEARKNKVEKPYIEGFKYCSKCERSLPMDIVHFSRSSESKNGFYSMCKECRGSSFGVKRPNRVWKAREGYKFCGKCFKELPLDDNHFYKSSQKKDGREPCCKVCTGIKEYGVRNKNKVYKASEGKKFCTICEREMKKSKFYKMMISKDGLASQCKDCHSTKMKVYRSLPEVKISRALYDKKWRRKYFSTERGKAAARKYNHLRRTRIAQTVFNYSEDIWEDTLKHFNNECAYCGKETKKLQQEHVIPLSKGGYYTKQNIIPACPHCNISKHNKDLMNWYPKQPTFSKVRLDKINRWTGTKNNIQQLSIL